MRHETNSLSYTPNGSTDDPFQPHGPSPIHRVSDTPRQPMALASRAAAVCVALSVTRKVCEANPERAHVQLKLAIDAIDTLVVPFETLDVAQMQVATTEAPRLLCRRQCHQPIRYQFVLIAQLRLIPIAGLADVERPARKPDARGFVPNGPLGRLFALSWLHHFSPSASFNKSFCMLFSAYIFLRRSFSSSKAFIREISDASALGTLLRNTLPCNACRHTSHAAFGLVQNTPSHTCKHVLPNKRLIWASLYFDCFIGISSFMVEEILLTNTPKFPGDYRPPHNGPQVGPELNSIAVR
jgi:hypothetical protein